MALTEGIFGEEGKAMFKNPRTTLTFDAANVDFSTDTITLDKTHLYVTGDHVQLTEDASGDLPAGVTAGTDYYVIVVNTTDIKLASSEANALAGTAVTLTDAGTGTNHVVTLQDYALMASCKNWNITFNKAVVDTTTLNSQFRSYKAGLIDASGSMTVMYEASDALAAKKARKIFDALVLPYDNGDGSVELYLSNTDVSDEDRKITADVLFTGGSVATQIGSIIEFNVNFQLNGTSGITFTNFT